MSDGDETGGRRSKRSVDAAFGRARPETCVRPDLSSRRRSTSRRIASRRISCLNARFSRPINVFIDNSAATPSMSETSWPLRSLKLDMDPLVSGVSAGHHLNFAVGPVVLAVRCLENEATTFREPSLEGDNSLLFYFVGSVTMRQLSKWFMA
jgi:hypothetical protein